jgi:hypothetical protein
MNVEKFKNDLKVCLEKGKEGGIGFYKLTEQFHTTLRCFIKEN